MKIIRSGLLSLIVLLAFLSTLQAASIKVAPGSDGKDRVILENDLLRLQVNPNRGARVEDFQYRPWGAIEIIKHKEIHGLLIDHFWQEGWPGQFWEAVYSYKVLTNGPAEVAVRFSCLSQDKGNALIGGILLEKTITLKEHARTVDVAIRLTNTGASGRYIGYWMQNICWLGGDMQGDRYFRPSRRGISMTASDPNAPGDAFVREPQAGWTAAVDEKTRTGLIFLMDYNSLWFLYNCQSGCTIEWQDDAVVIPPGKSWQTEISMTPVAAQAAVDYASGNFLVAAALREDTAAGKLNLTADFQPMRAAIKSLTVRSEIEALQTHRKETCPAQTVSNLAFAPQSIVFSLPYDTARREPAVVRLTFQGETAAGKTFEESTELWHPGTLPANVNMTDGSPLYSLRTPKKTKTVIKPDMIARLVKNPPQVLFLKGLLSPSYKLEPAIRMVCPAAVVKNGYAYNGGVFGWALDYFPYDYDELMSFDLVVLGDVSAECLGEAALEMLKDYCAKGGNLLVLGGPCAYGNGNYQASALNEMLPVLIQKPFDLQAVGRDAKVTGVQEMPAAGLRPEYIHQVKAKPEANVLVTCDSLPMIVLGKFGSGTVCCVTTPPMGKSIFCDQPQWQDVLEYLFKNLGMNR